MVLEFDQDGLKEFVAMGDKSPPPVFAGRKDILQDIEAAAVRSWKGSDALNHGNPGETRVIQGAPGAGKSSLVSQLAKGLQEKMVATEETALVPLPRIVILSPGMVVNDLPGVLTIMAGAAGLSSGIWHKIHAKIRAGATVGAVSIATELGLPPESKIPQHLSGLTNMFPPKKWKAPVILAIDEAQSFRGGPETAHALFLKDIHNSTMGLPVLLVLAGLGDTAARAGEMDLTRGKIIHEIGGLAPDEVGAFMLDFCRKFGIDHLGHGERLVELAAPCEGWPRHLHFCLQALGKEVLKFDGDLAKVSWETIMSNAKDSRFRYYQGQQSQEMKIAASLVGKVLCELRTEDKLHNVINMVSLHAGKKSGVEWQLPEGMNAQSFTNHLIHQGALQEKTDNTISFSIPSFRSYLIQNGGLEVPFPTDDEIEMARNNLWNHSEALKLWQDKSSTLTKARASTEHMLDEQRKKLENTGFLSFKRKWELQHDVVKVEEQLANIIEHQEKLPPPPLPPSPETLRIAGYHTNIEVNMKTAKKDVKDMVENGIFFPCLQHSTPGSKPPGLPNLPLLFVVSSASQVMPTDSYVRKHHYFVIWDGNKPDNLRTLKTAFPELKMVVEPSLRTKWPDDIPMLQSNEADRLIQDAGLTQHMKMEMGSKVSPTEVIEPPQISGKDTSPSPEDLKDSPRLEV